MNSKKIINPILKWAGGKRQLIPELKKYIPAKFNKYVEPFFGGGALFFHLANDNSIKNDKNPEIINL
jgi:DNA adenine methylase